MAIKTLHLTNAYHPTSGGIRTFYAALLEAANGLRRPMRLVVPGHGDDVEEVGAYGRIYTLAAASAPLFDRRYRLLLPTRYMPPRSSEICRLLRDEQPDLVEICDKYALPYLAALLRRNWMPDVRRPTLVGLSCERMDDNVAAYVSRASVLRSLSQAYIRHVYGPPFDAHVANSEYTADELRSALWDRHPGFVRVSPMGVSFREFGPAWRDLALRRRLLADAGGTTRSVLLLYAGRLSPEKNLPLLVDMMEHLARSPHDGGPQDYRLVLLGDGPLWPKLEADAARRAAGRVMRLPAMMDRASLATMYASADVFVHPNPREPFGIGPLEAMASFVPVVAPSHGGVLTYANAGNAWLAAPDGASFAHAVRSVVLEPDPLRLAAARETARQHDWSHVAERYFATLDAVHRQRGRDARTPVRTAVWRPAPASSAAR
jgi:glycosyltransferase involved in cell wall biosynthesis